ncbi:MAG: 1-deoxy-D-xylulose-5-phosphate reductoisomerase [Gammaproteobacteria bacterium]|nr:1-deoxy-D-xylulose-5-phosphate reductoisomerase [Gammaproteobacteria bacterium]MCP5458815.1 1-deoxy-D-xylulose-5-phosphate reductoisomerase [Gammaproteobacteria bacterium]
MIGVTILGSTGSVGVSTLDVLRRHRERFQVIALTAQRRIDELYAQCLEWRPSYAVVGDADGAQRLADRLRRGGDAGTEVLAGEESLCRVAALPETHYVMAAIVGAAGLLPTLAAVEAGKRVLLANKEALVVAGRLFMEAVHRHHATLLPIDSEHNAIFQCLPPGFQEGLGRGGVTRILLTGSGGPFRNTSLEQLATVTPAQACAHPNWSMGPKISVDSATMMNKGLETIEARWLFGAEPDQIRVVVHPQSIIHSLVEYADGSLLAQLSHPDMRVPIAHALAWPQRMASGVATLDLFEVGRLDFQAPDFARFPCLRLAFQALARGGTAAAVLNAANEVAVGAFLERRIRFTDIPEVVETTLERMTIQEAASLPILLESDSKARRIASEWIAAAEIR